MPEALASLVDEGIIERVLRPLMSGKEAQVYLVESAGTTYVAKVYKEAANRTFKHRADYTEGRKVRNSRDQRAIAKRSRHGRDQDEAAWRSTEVDMIYRLQRAGVRVPAPHQFIDGVLVMELVRGVDGAPAPRLGDVELTPDEATKVYQQLIREAVRMLCAGVVHGDLSDFNVLLGADGPVIIDFPQSVDPSKNQNARRLLIRDIANLHRFYTRWVPGGRAKPYAEEMWSLFESNQLTPETVLGGQFRASQKKADTKELLEFIAEARDDAQKQRGGRSRGPSGASSQVSAGARPRRVEVVVNQRGPGGGAPHSSSRPRRVELVVNHRGSGGGTLPSSSRPRRVEASTQGRDGQAQGGSSCDARAQKHRPRNDRAQKQRAQDDRRSSSPAQRQDDPGVERHSTAQPGASVPGRNASRPGGAAPGAAQGRTADPATAGQALAPRRPRRRRRRKPASAQAVAPSTGGKGGRAQELPTRPTSTSNSQRDARREPAPAVPQPRARRSKPRHP